MDLLKLLEEVQSGKTSPLLARIKIRTMNLKMLRSSVNEMKTSDWSELSSLMVQKNDVL